MKTQRAPKYIYFVRQVSGIGCVKIGCSDLPERRLRALMAWSPEPLEILVRIPGDIRLEFNIQDCFSEHHSHHEWFRPAPKLLRLIADLQEGIPIELALDLSKRGAPLHNRRHKGTPQFAHLRRPDRAPQEGAAI